MTAALDRTPSRTAQAPAARRLSICSLLPSRTSPLPHHTSPSSSRPSAARAGTGEPGWVLLACEKNKPWHMLFALGPLNRQAVAHRSRLKAGMTMERWRSCCICRGGCGTQASPPRRPGLCAGICKGFAACAFCRFATLWKFVRTRKVESLAPMTDPGPDPDMGGRDGAESGVTLRVAARHIFPKR